MQNPTLSIVIPTLNEEENIGSLLDDIVANTYQDYEVIVSDSGSIDNTRDVVQARIREHAQIKLVEAHNGVSVTRNIGAAHARGEYILFLDADTRLRSYFLERTVKEMMRRDLDMGIHYCQPIGKEFMDKVMCTIINFFCGSLQYLFPISIGGGGITVKRDVHEKVRGFNESMAIAEDIDYGRRASNIGRIRTLRCVKSKLNTRRFKQEGRFRILGEWALTLLYYSVGIKMEYLPFQYKFGQYRSQN